MTQAQIDAYSTRTVQVHEKERELARAWEHKHGRAPTSRELLHIASDAALLSRQGKDAGPVDWQALVARWDAGRLGHARCDSLISAMQDVSPGQAPGEAGGSQVPEAMKPARM